MNQKQITAAKIESVPQAPQNPEIETYTSMKPGDPLICGLVGSVNYLFGLALFGC